MKWNFWFVLILLFVFSNEYLSNFMLAIFVGELSTTGALDKAFLNWSLKSYFFSAAFRAIPFVALAMIVAKNNERYGNAGKTALWLTLIGMSMFHVFGYWQMHYPLFINDEVSSTFALSVIWIPVWATILLVVGLSVLHFIRHTIAYIKSPA